VLLDVSLPYFILIHFSISYLFLSLLFVEACTVEYQLFQLTTIMFVCSINFVTLRQLLLLPFTRSYDLPILAATLSNKVID
jgi:hypothetical protein